MRTPTLIAALTLFSVVSAADGRPTLTVGASKDTSLIESGTGDVSCGGAGRLFVGQTAFSGIRRAMLAFNVSSIPAGSTITGVSLTLNMAQTITGAQDISAHRVSANWGEGTASGSAPFGGDGAAAGAGDATWIYRAFSTSAWATPGGDFVAAASATVSVDQPGLVVWSGAGMVADVQAWIGNPSQNFGWILIAPEGGETSAKAFDSRESTEIGPKPSLQVTYTPPCLGDVTGDGQVNTADLTALLGHFGQSVPPGTGGDLDGNGFVNTADLTFLLGHFGSVC